MFFITEKCRIHAACGVSQTPKIKYVSEEEAEKISRNPDWQCSFCGSLNSDDLNVCKNCGATKEDSERNYFEMRQQEEEKKRKKEEKKESC